MSKCKCITQKGTRCSRNATEKGYCYQHANGKCKKHVTIKQKTIKKKEKTRKKKERTNSKKTENINDKNLLPELPVDVITNNIMKNMNVADLIQMCSTSPKYKKICNEKFWIDLAKVKMPNFIHHIKSIKEAQKLLIAHDIANKLVDLLIKENCSLGLRTIQDKRWTHIEIYNKNGELKTNDINIEDKENQIINSMTKMFAINIMVDGNIFCHKNKKDRRNIEFIYQDLEKSYIKASSRTKLILTKFPKWK